MRNQKNTQYKLYYLLFVKSKFILNRSIVRFMYIIFLYASTVISPINIQHMLYANNHSNSINENKTQTVIVVKEADNKITNAKNSKNNTQNINNKQVKDMPQKELETTKQNSKEKLNTINNKINNIESAISKLNQELSIKHNQQQTINQMIANAQKNDKNYQQTIQKIEQLKNKNIQSTKQILTQIDQMTQKSEAINNHLKILAHHIMTQINAIKNKTDNVLTDQSNKNDLKLQLIYVVKIIKQQQNRMQAIYEDITKLKISYEQINKQIIAFNQKIIQLKAKHTQNKKQEILYLNQFDQVNHQINNYNKKIVDLVKQKNILNNLLNSIIKQISTQKSISAKNTEKIESFTNICKPLIANRIISNFGNRKNGIKSDGILFAVNDNQNIYAIADGLVKYASKLANFGYIIVIEHPKNYISIYSGILPKVQINKKVKCGETIASSGMETNRPMQNGVYFEIRKFGTPIDPNKLIN